MDIKQPANDVIAIAPREDLNAGEYLLNFGSTTEGYEFNEFSDRQKGLFSRRSRGRYLFCSGRQSEDYCCLICRERKPSLQCWALMIFW